MTRSGLRVLCLGTFALSSSALFVAACTKSFESDATDESGAAGAAGEGDQQGGTGGLAAGSGGRGGSSGARNDAGTSGSPTGGSGGSGMGGANGGTGGGQPEGGAGTGPGTPSYRDLILADEPLAYWRMSIASGRSIPDETGSGNALVLQGTGHALGATGAVRNDADTAVGFDGMASFAIATDARAFDFAERAPFTLECWARRVTGGPSYFQHLFSNLEGTPGTRDGYIFYLLPEPAMGENQRSSFEYDRQGSEVGLWGSVAEAETWGHYVAVFDGSNALLYVNGTLESIEPVTGGFPARTGAFAVGRSANENRDYFRGSLDEMAVYPRALGVGEIAEHFDRAIALSR